MSNLTFNNFLREKLPWYKIDEQAAQAVELLNQYAWGDPRFESEFPKHMTYIIKKDGAPLVVQSRFSFTKGICLVGTIGSGKTRLMETFQLYLQWARSPRTFLTSTVWKYADQYGKIGDDALIGIMQGNRFFDELCKLDTTGEPRDERAQYMGNRVLMGEKIIDLRYENSLRRGLTTHFTTNEGLQSISNIYGGRAMSRLVQMCNIIPLLGRDRRFEEEPLFDAEGQFAAVRREIEHKYQQADGESALAMAVAGLDGRLRAFKSNRDVQFLAVDFDTLRTMGISVCSDEELHGRPMAAARTVRADNMKDQRSARSRKIVDMHISGNLDGAEEMIVLGIAKRLAVAELATKLLEAGKDSFFN